MRMQEYTTPRLTPKRGFTIVELLIVIVVVAILVGLVYVAYTTISRQALEASMQSDLKAAQSSIAVMKAGKKNYPATAATANNGQGLKASGQNQIAYGGSGANFCVAVTNPGTTTTFRYIATTGKIENGHCGGSVTTFAGQYGTGYVGEGIGTGAGFSWPSGLSIDSAGNLYVGDCGTAVRKITPGGQTSTIGGLSGTSGYADGPAVDSRFQCVLGTAVDSAGNVYASVSGGLFKGVRKITPGGQVSTLAGSDTAGAADLNGTSATFRSPYGLTVDESGTVYLADGSSNHRIRRITSNGDVTTIAGSTNGFNEGNGTAAQFSYPHGIARDSAGNLYVADSGNNRIRKIAPNGDVSTFAGSGTAGNADGTGTAATFDWPTAIAIDNSGNLYVSDGWTSVIRKITPSQEVTTVAGTGVYGYTDTVGMFAQFSWIENGLAVDATGNIYVADSDNKLIRKIAPAQ